MRNFSIPESGNIASINTNTIKTELSETESESLKDDDEDTNQLIKNESAEGKSISQETKPEATFIAEHIKKQMGMALNPAQMNRIKDWLKVWRTDEILAGVDKAAQYGAQTLDYVEKAIKTEYQLVEALIAEREAQ